MDFAPISRSLQVKIDILITIAFVVLLERFMSFLAIGARYGISLSILN